MKLSAVNNFSTTFGNKQEKVMDAKPGTSQMPIPGITIPASNDVKKAINTQKNIGYAGIAATALAIGGSFIKNRAVRFLTAIPAIATTAVAGLIFFASAKKTEQMKDVMDSIVKEAETNADANKPADNAPKEEPAQPTDKKD